MYKKLKRSKVIRALTSQKLTVIGLILLTLLTFWGTLYQAEFGLYAAQKKFFFTWFVPLGTIQDPIPTPIPGAIFVLWMLFINLVLASIFTFKHTWKKAGILLTHWGMLILVVGSGLTYYFAEESQVTILEGDTSNHSVHYFEWELSIWKNDNINRQVLAVDEEYLKDLGNVYIPKYNLNMDVHKYFINSAAYATTPENLISAKHINASSLLRIAPKSLDLEAERNMPAMSFSVKLPDGKWQQILLSGVEEIPTSLKIKEDTFYFQLRRKKFELPIEMKLVDFRKKTHLGSSMAKAYESTVEINDGQLKHNVLIWMNHPYRYEDYTFFQSSFSQGPNGLEFSTFAVVRNPGRLVPYISCIVTGIGLCIHFLILFFAHIQRQRAKA